MSNQDYYKTLGISKGASASEVKKAFLKQAKQYHPDKNSGDANAEQKFKEINEAYEILKDDQKRAAYDQMGHSAFQQAGGASAGGFNGGRRGGHPGMDPNDIFGDFFSDFMGGGRRSRNSGGSAKGADLKYDLSITLEEAFTGLDKKINFTTEVRCSPCSGRGAKNPNSVMTCGTCGGAGAVRMQQGFFAVEQTCRACGGAGQTIKDPCGDCSGTGRQTKQKSLIVNIPAGVEDGVRIRVAGEGESGYRGGPGGDLYVFINIKQHDIYQVEGSNIHCKLPLSFTTAALGGEVEVPTIDGATVSLTIPAGTETGDKLRLRGKGMSKIRSTMRGDMYTHAYIQTPKNLSQKQKDLLQELDKELGSLDSGNYKDNGFFAKMRNIWS